MNKEFKLFQFSSTGKVEIFKSKNLTRVKVGRVDGVDLVVSDSAVSRSHAEFIFAGSEWFLQDLGSTNGSVLNGVQLPSNEVRILRPDDTIQFGDSEFIFWCENAYLSGNLNTAYTPRIFIFQGPTYQGEFPIGPSTDFTYGGSNATIPSAELGTDELIFIIRQHLDSQLLLSCKHPEIRPDVNGVSKTGRVELNDRDIIKIASLSVIVSQSILDSQAVLDSGEVLDVQGGARDTGVDFSPGSDSGGLRERQDTLSMVSSGSIFSNKQSGGGYLTPSGSVDGFSAIGKTSRSMGGGLFSTPENITQSGSISTRENTVEIEEEIPDQVSNSLQDRMSNDSWGDHQKKRKRASTATLFTFDESLSNDSDTSMGFTVNKVSRSQSDLVGVKRFSSPNLAVVQAEEERKQKKYAIFGVITLVVLLVMMLILLDLYVLSLKG
ncbi:MAG TPA: FHA domain-containing protein [Oligoflexia bacterium]|nr:FHA domain-containing protein [Oligoflexia bacterium]HMP49685.1 FHA domain-containing protein [Oligoflexia bacterium]